MKLSMLSVYTLVDDTKEILRHEKLIFIYSFDVVGDGSTTIELERVKKYAASTTLLQ